MRTFLLLSLLVSILTACSKPGTVPTNTTTTSTVVPSHTPTAAAASSATPTRDAFQETIHANQTQNAVHHATSVAYQTQEAEYTATSTYTSTSTSQPYPTFTPIPTFTPAPVQQTPAPPSECPPGGTPVTLTTDDISAISLEESILGYLNARGSSVGLGPLLNSLAVNMTPPAYIESRVFPTDVTGDGVPDVVMDILLPEAGVYATTAAMVFVCQDGQYVNELFLLLSPQEGLYPGGGYEILAIRDMNLDGVREVLLVLKVNSARYFYILEWDGSEFVSLIEPRFEEILLHLVYYVDAYVADGVVSDTDGDGTLELVITQGIQSSSSGPQRVRREVWAWDGYAFRKACSKAATSPVYRFQAVQDGDDATLCGNYDQALAFYQQAVFDEQLLGWSQGQLWPDSAYGDEPTPTPDPGERSWLQAYGRYRIMLLHALRGYKPEARIVYDTLLEKFPEGAVGNQYAQLADAFWEAYTASGDVSAACQAAIENASTNREAALSPLGSGFYGYNNRDYAPEDICPLNK